LKMKRKHYRLRRQLELCQKRHFTKHQNKKTSLGWFFLDFL
jgi:hypothetical protein